MKPLQSRSVFESLIKSGEILAAFCFIQYLEKGAILEIVEDNIVLDELKEYFNKYKDVDKLDPIEVCNTLAAEAGLRQYIKHSSIPETNLKLIIELKNTDKTDALIANVLKDYKYFSLKF